MTDDHELKNLELWYQMLEYETVNAETWTTILWWRTLSVQVEARSNKEISERKRDKEAHNVIVFIQT